MSCDKHIYACYNAWSMCTYPTQSRTHVIWLLKASLCIAFSNRYRLPRKVHICVSVFVRRTCGISSLFTIYAPYAIDVQTLLRYRSNTTSCESNLKSTAWVFEPCKDTKSLCGVCVCDVWICVAQQSTRLAATENETPTRRDGSITKLEQKRTEERAVDMSRKINRNCLPSYHYAKWNECAW